MALVSRHKFSELWRKECCVLLALCFLSGLTFGIYAYMSADEFLRPLMRGIVYDSVSIVNLLCVTCLPFLLSAFAVYVCHPGFLLAVSFGKAFVFSFVFLGIYCSLPGTGWFFLWLLYFTDLLSLPVLYFFWLRNLSGERRVSFPSVAFYLSLVLLIGSLYIRFIPPFLA